MCALDQAEHDVAAPGAACDETGRMAIDPKGRHGTGEPAVRAASDRRGEVNREDLLQRTREGVAVQVVVHQFTVHWDRTFPS